jgi:hypothetical protein
MTIKRWLNLAEKNQRSKVIKYTYCDYKGLRIGFFPFSPNIAHILEKNPKIGPYEDASISNPSMIYIIENTELPNPTLRAEYRINCNPAAFMTGSSNKMTIIMKYHADKLLDDKFDINTIALKRKSRMSEETYTQAKSDIAKILKVSVKHLNLFIDNKAYVYLNNDITYYYLFITANELGFHGGHKLNQLRNLYGFVYSYLTVLNSY